ncbi:MAG: HAMP domain-containing histidine kinase [Gammaproteobacteria bacterium]|nr:HAMP domain-containing histidine kinase [Gammaproteobacteria bacterium]MDH3464795.1 HAMP domain-containing histidine kinase [Gammaproteobacteria bacterium]
MPKTLYARLSVVLALLFVAVGLIYALASDSLMRRHLDAVSQTFNRNLARTLVDDRNLVREGRINMVALERTFEDYMEINPSIEIYLLDVKGKILSFSADPGKVIRSSVSLAPIHEFLAADGMYPLLGDDPRNIERKKAFSVTAVPSVNNVQGYLYVVLRGEAFDSVDRALQDSYFLRLSAYTVIVSLVVGLIAGLLIFWLMTRRLRRLSGMLERFRGSNFTHDILDVPNTARHQDELDELHHTCALMSHRIVEQIRKLKLMDGDRRELVANVSHDLRTPLASINGYLETLKIKDADLSVTVRNEYLDAALRSGHRMAKLVDDLFELAKLEAVETRPHIEPFALRDLIQDVIQKFRLRADNGKIQLSADMPTDIPLVLGDIGLIERVLENLIANALDHAGSTVDINVNRVGNSLMVAVCDDGVGIADSDRGRLFERFYRGNNAHRGDSHTGLGLAITKQILALHGAQIEVQSDSGHGARFFFSLPVWNSQSPPG